jgi:hypothetical protein
MSGHPDRSPVSTGAGRRQPPGAVAELVAGRTRWIALAAFAAFAGIGVLRENPSLPVAAAAAGVAVIAAGRADRGTAGRRSRDGHADRGQPGRAGHRHGLGVATMRERAESLGGTCEAGPGGRGWLVRATLPLGTGPWREGS